MQSTSGAWPPIVTQSTYSRMIGNQNFINSSQTTCPQQCDYLLAILMHLPINTVLAESTFGYSSRPFGIPFISLSLHSLTSPLSNLLLQPTSPNWPTVPKVVSQRLWIWSLKNMALYKYVYWLIDWLTRYVSFIAFIIALLITHFSTHGILWWQHFYHVLETKWPFVQWQQCIFCLSFLRLWPRFLTSWWCKVRVL